MATLRMFCGLYLTTVLSSVKWVAIFFGLFHGFFGGWTICCFVARHFCVRSTACDENYCTTYPFCFSMRSFFFPFPKRKGMVCHINARDVGVSGMWRLFAISTMETVVCRRLIDTTLIIGWRACTDNAALSLTVYLEMLSHSQRICGDGEWLNDN